MKRNPKESSLAKFIINKTVWYAFAAILAVVIAIAGSVFIIYHSQTLYADKLEPPDRSFNIYDSTGTQLSSDTDFRPVSYSDLPDHTCNAFIAVEDKDFFKHHGLAYPRIARAAYENIVAGKVKAGASTISQQLIKNTHLSGEKTLRRKIREATLAVKLERNYDKSKILEMYLNAIYFGNGCTGIGSAAYYYFDKSPADLTARESAALAGLIKNPSRYCPATRYDNFAYRADLVLQLMNAQGYLSQADYDEAKTQPLSIQKRTLKHHNTAFKTAIVTSAARLLGVDQNDLQTSGIKIHTFLDPKAQKTIAEIASAQDYQILNASNQTADICIISATPQGAVTGYFATNQSLRTAKRNFASSIKPLTVYAPAFELGVVMPASQILDEAYAAGDFHPKNYDNKYHGIVTVREALEQSYNIPAVKVLEYTGIERSCAIGRKLGLNLTDNETLGVALGNTQQGTTFFELLSGYCTLSNKGKVAAPSLIKRIESRDGTTLWEWTPSNQQAISEDTAFLITDILRSGTKTGTAKKLSSLPFDIAAKTGTSERDNTNTNTDVINCSFTNDTVLLVWAGNTNMSPANDLPQGTTGGGITSFMARDIQKGLNNTPNNFTPPSSVERIDGEYCSKRYPHKTIKNSPAATHTPISLKGSICDTGAPMLTFEANPKSQYEVYKKDGTTVALQEVVSGKHGEYVYLDRNAKQSKVYEYWVSETTPSGTFKSNVVKLYTTDVNNNTPLTGIKQVGRGKNWFF